jgi:hypothetical protein
MWGRMEVRLHRTCWLWPSAGCLTTASKGYGNDRNTSPWGRTLALSVVGVGRWSYQKAFGAVVLFSLIVRLIVLACVGNAPLVPDATDYCMMSARLLSGQFFVPYWPPGLPYYLMPFVAAGFSDMALRAAMLPFWLLFCWGTYRLAIVTGTEKVAWLILLIYSVAPAAIHFSIEPLTQLPLAALLLVALSAAIDCGRRAGWGASTLLGGALGCMPLIRPSTLPLLLLLPTMTFFGTRRLARSLLQVALGGALIFCWMLKAHQMTGEWMLNSSNSVNLFYGNNSETPLYRTWFFGSHAKANTEEIHHYPAYEATLSGMANLSALEQARALQKAAMSYIQNNPGLFLLRTVNRVRAFWGFDVFTAARLRTAGPIGHRWFLLAFVMDALIYLMAAGFAVFWMALASRDFWRDRETLLLASAIMLYALPYWVSMSHATFHFPVVMPLVLLGAKARQTAEVDAGRWLRGLVGLLVLGMIQVEWLWNLADGLASRGANS